jgi:hypothetical protein
MNPVVKTKFDSYPGHIKPKMLELRDLIYEVAKSTEGAGEIEETLKWGEPAYLTKKTKSGTTIRIDWKDKNPDQLAMYVSCNTSLIDSYRRRFDGKLTFEGNRAVTFPIDKPLPKDELMICMQMALLYHVNR